MKDKMLNLWLAPITSVLILSISLPMALGGTDCPICKNVPAIEDFQGTGIYDCCEVGLQNSPAYRSCQGKDSDFECFKNDTPTMVTSVNVYGNGDCANCIWTPGPNSITLPIKECWTDDTGCGGNG